MNTVCNLSGSRQPSWIFVVPTSCPRMAHCHPTDLSSGTHNLYDSAKNLRRPNISRFPTVQYRVATRLSPHDKQEDGCAASRWDKGRPANWPVASLLSRIAGRRIKLPPGLKKPSSYGYTWTIIQAATWSTSQLP